MDANRIKKYVDLKVTKQLYLDSPYGILYSFINTLLILFIFNNVVTNALLFSWAAVMLTWLVCRFFFCRYALSRKITPLNMERRLQQFIICVFGSGFIFGSAGVLLLSVHDPMYDPFLFMLMGGMFSGSVGVFAIKLRVFYAFSAPIFMPIIIYSLIIGEEIHMIMSLIGIVFVIMITVVARRMNTTIIDAYSFSIENKLLAETTKQLNEKLKFSNENLKNLAFKDTMTNTSNRRYITEILNPEVDRFASSLQQSFNEDEPKLIYGVYIIDIDHFKDVNDTWGHKCGDKILIQFVNVVQSLIRKQDTLCRWGGEEFVIILKLTDPEYFKVFAKKLIDEINRTCFKVSDEMSINKTCSLGYARFPFFEHLPTALSLDQTIEIADQALYYAKENGRNKAILAEYNSAKGSINSLKGTHVMMKDMNQSLQATDVIFTEIE